MFLLQNIQTLTIYKWRIFDKSFFFFFFLLCCISKICIKNGKRLFNSISPIYIIYWFSPTNFSRTIDFKNYKLPNNWKLKLVFHCCILGSFFMWAKSFIFFTLLTVFIFYNSQSIKRMLSSYTKYLQNMQQIDYYQFFLNHS